MIPGVKPAAIKAAEKKPAPRLAPKAPPNYVEKNAPRPKPASKIFSRPLAAATKENIRTGAMLQQYRQEHPPRPSFLQKVLGTVGKGEHAIESVGSAALHGLEELPGVSGSKTGYGGSL